MVPVASAAINNRAALHVEDGVGLGIIRRQDVAGFRGRQHEIRHHHGHAVIGRQLHAHRPHRAADVSGAGDDGTQHARGDVIGMAFELGRFVQNPVRLPVQAEQMIGDDHAGGERGGARSEPFAERNVVLDFECDRRQSVRLRRPPQPARSARSDCLRRSKFERHRVRARESRVARRGSKRHVR